MLCQFSKLLLFSCLCSPAKLPCTTNSEVRAIQLRPRSFSRISIRLHELTDFVHLFLAERMLLKSIMLLVTNTLFWWFCPLLWTPFCALLFHFFRDHHAHIMFVFCRYIFSLIMLYFGGRKCCRQSARFLFFALFFFSVLFFPWRARRALLLFQSKCFACMFVG